MPKTVTCPQLHDMLAENDCLENFGGLGMNVYAFVYSDLAKPLEPTEGTNKYPTFSSSTFKTGKGLYKFECKDGSQGHSFESLGFQKGFKQILDYVLESVNAASADIARSINNLKVGYVIEDVSTNILVYDKQHYVMYDSGNIKGDTGKKPEDERVLTLSGVLQPTAWGRYEIPTPEGGWDSLLASAASKEPGE